MESFLNFLRESFSLLTIEAIGGFIYALPVALIFVFAHVWVLYRRVQFFESQESVLLEIRVPQDIPKSPLAMEIVIMALQQTTGESTWYDVFILGKSRASFSLEIVSIEGDVRFYIKTLSRVRKFIETQVYSQYPNAEIIESPDYVSHVPYAQEGSDWNLFGVEFQLLKPDPYPIKTYIDYNLDKDPKEELKVDPILPMIEFLGDLGRGEQAWYQILIRANKGKKDRTTPWKRDWQDEGRELVEKMMKESKERSGPPPEIGGEDFRYSLLTEGERNVTKAIERNISKLGFDCGIRALYLGKGELYNPANIAGLFGVLKQFNSNDLNGFRPKDHTDFDYPWQDYINIPLFKSTVGVPFFSLKGKRTIYKKWKFFDAYRKRSWFFPPYERKPYVLNAEELATIYHFPGRVAETPTFKRIESRRAEPPTDLPI